MHRLADYLYRRAARIVVVVQAAADLITARGISPDRIVVIPHAVRWPDLDASASDHASREWHRRLTQVRARAGTVIMYVGALGTANALRHVVSAARGLHAAGRDDIHLVFIGEGPERSDLEHASEGIPNVHFLGPVNKSEVASALSFADAGLATMIRGPWDSGVSMNKIADYFGAAIPVIMMGSPRNNPVLEARAGWAVDYEDVNGLRDAVIAMADLGVEGREELGRNGRRYAGEYLDLERLTRRLARVIS
jgi:glycosyltransferase involved in cell wall biosynthesis